jgi:hypothetical protein
MPYINLVGMIALIYFKQWLDSGSTFRDKIPKTKKITISQFVE